MNSIEQLHTQFCAFLVEQFSISQEQAKSCSFTLNVDESRQMFGDINTNAAMTLAKLLKKNPAQIATTITQSFKNPALSTIESAGPGFLNLFLTTKTLQAITHDLVHQGEQFFRPTVGKHERICIEFVSANPTGPLHFGHGRGGTIGDVLANVLRFIGHTVHEEFYINDAGAQISKLGTSFKIRCQQAAGQEVALPEDAYHGEYLLELAQQCLAEHGTDVLVQSHGFFVSYAKEHLLSAIKKTLERFGVTFDTWFSEKTLHEHGRIRDALAILARQGHLYEREGAVWFASTKFGDDKDRVVKKASGELTYVAADIAYMCNKIDRGYTKLIMILGHDHHSYLTRLHAVQQALGFEQYPLDIILYQLVKMKEDGQLVRMSKRAGKIVTLDDVIETVGPDVARFFYLHRKADAQLEFDIALALKKTDENPVYYLQYAYVRIKSILAKAAEHEQLQHITADDAVHIDRVEALLIKKVVSLKTTIAEVGALYQTHVLTYFGLELATLFHKYYSHNRVIDISNPLQSKGRLLVIGQLKLCFELILKLLEINRPERM